MSQKGVLNTGGATSSIDLPTGWKREERPQKTGIMGSKTEVVYISPENAEAKSLGSLQKLLPNFDFAYFDFKSGRSLRPEARKLRQKQREIVKVSV